MGDPEYKNTPLHEACENGNLETVRELINNGANVNAQNPEDNSFFEGKATPLHIACRDVNIDLVKLLLENHAEVNILDQKNNTPLHVCFEKFLPYNKDLDYSKIGYSKIGTDNLELVKLLVEKGANVDAENVDDETPLYKVLSMGDDCYYGDYAICFIESRINIAKYLIDKGANLKNNKVIELLENLKGFNSKDADKDMDYKQELEKAFQEAKQKESASSVGGKRKTKRRKTRTKRKTKHRKTRTKRKTKRRNRRKNIKK